MELLKLVEQLFQQYGYFVLLIGLPLDAIALPIPPGNSTLTYAGYLSYRGILQWLPSITLALVGSIIGITTTYVLGYKLGMPFIRRYGKWLSLKTAYIEQTRHYYNKYGNSILLISFFVPGVRQFIGYFIGIIRVPYHTFVLYAYSGAALWVGAFFAIGYIFGDQWQQIFLLVEEYLKYLLIGFASFLFIFFIWKYYNLRKS